MRATFPKGSDVADDDPPGKADHPMQAYRSALTGRDPTFREDDDLPVLTDVIVTDDLTSAPIPAPVRLEPTLRAVPIDRGEVVTLARQMLLEQLPAQREAIAGELAGWLDRELPGIVLRVLDGLGDQIAAKVTAEAMATLLPRIHAALEQSQPSQDAG